MLTQGWVGYDWKDVFYPSANPIAYQPETEFTISGTVINAFGGAIEKSKVLVLSTGPFIFKETLTNKEGKFKFNNLFPIDTAIYKLQATNKNGKEFNVGIKMDEVKPPVFLPLSNITPWYVNSDTIRLKNTSTKSAQQKAIANYMGEGNMMKEVTIKEKKIIKGSKNLNGPGEADQIIDEEELKKADKMTLSELLEKRLKGFVVNGLWTRVLPGRGYKTTPLAYTLDSKKIKFVIDGIDLDFYYTGMPARLFYIKNYLDYFTAEDVTGIEVLSSSKYSTKYHVDMARTDNGISHQFFAYIEITTRSKQGPFMKVTPGTYLYKTLPFTLPLQFYSPKYTVKNKTVAMSTDMRSTLHWEPNIMTDKDGKATLSFYSADKPSNYTIFIEGLNSEGEVGYNRQKIKVMVSK
ncbi:MAG: carboxypeptidase regulatory-like domain-containing protein [Sphingobacteriaceae bacterium]|nr:MAG: carboxypeptidase regulatory-like domain-containing protein [Sphingobacteriaceae bacterium]